MASDEVKFLSTKQAKGERQLLSTNKKAPVRELNPQFPSLATIQQELGNAQPIDDFCGKQGILARVFAGTLEAMLEAELPE